MEGMPVKRLLRAAAFVAAVAPWPGYADNAPGRTIVCWSDDRGVRVCGDHVPPEYARKTRQIYDQNGVLIQTLPGELTAEERAAEERKAREAKLQQEQAAHDSFLLQSYRSVADLEAERDNRLASLETRLQLAEKAVADGAAVLNELNARADAERDDGNDPEPALLRQIRSYEASQADNLNVVADLRGKRDALSAQYERDIQRYLVLRNPQPPPSR